MIYTGGTTGMPKGVMYRIGDAVTSFLTQTSLLYGLDMATKPEDLATILSINVPRWQQEMGHREEHLKQFPNMPEAIWEAHRRVAAALDAEA